MVATGIRFHKDITRHPGMSAVKTHTQWPAAGIAGRGSGGVGLGI